MIPAVTAAVRGSLRPQSGDPAPVAVRTPEHAAQIGSLLSRGEYERAWRLLEQFPDTFLNGMPVPPWEGRRAQMIVVVPGEGLGDQILFARFVPLIKARGVHRVVMLTPSPLARLFRRLTGVDDVIAIPRASGRHTDAHVTLPCRPDGYARLCSLPRIFRCTDAQAVPRTPYISADPADIARWRQRLPAAPLRVGLVWRGDVHNVEDAQRSLALSTLAPLWQVPGAAFISLQVGAGEDEARSSPLPLVHLGGDLRNFADTAAVLSQLDVLVSVDTSAANLAGAMGLPTWVLHRHGSEFRWAHGWYPSARLFYQQHPGDWSGPIAALVEALQELVEQRRSR